MIKDAKDLLAAEPTLLEIQLPCIVVGDIHGQVSYSVFIFLLYIFILQYLDLHRIFVMVGEKNKSGLHTRRFLFLWYDSRYIISIHIYIYIYFRDYVDRGPQSLECIVLLLVNKIAFPKMFNLLRGNHESIAINRTYGFYAELHDRFPEEEATILWRAFNDLFAYLPLAALIHGRILCMHGGIGPGLNSLDDIRDIKRPLDEPNTNNLACDLLWADPMIDLNGFVPNSVRGVSVYFGENEVIKLCEKLKIDLIVRAHQMSKFLIVKYIYIYILILIIFQC